MSSEARVKRESLSSIKSKLLKPALTSHFLCEFQPPNSGFINFRVDTNSNKRFDKLSLACSEASLPGSSLATIDIDNDFYGVSEKHAYRRIYDDRADFTFYVDADEYYVIRFFESWIGFIVNEMYNDNRGNNLRIKSQNYSYRATYPEKYYADALSITKFERDFGATNLGTSSTNTLKYNFVNAYPISISSMPVSYDTSQLLKCTVSFSYTRYWVQNLGQSSISSPDPRSSGNPESNTRQSTTTSADITRIAFAGRPLF